MPVRIFGDALVVNLLYRRHGFRRPPSARLSRVDRAGDDGDGGIKESIGKIKTLIAQASGRLPAIGME